MKPLTITADLHLNEESEIAKAGPNEATPKSSVLAAINYFLSMK